MKETTLNFDKVMREGRAPILIVVFSNAYGVRIWGTQYPPKVVESGLWPIVERAARIVDVGPLDEGNPEFSFLETQTQSDPAGLSLTLSNDDLALSRLEADENILSARVQYMAFPPGSTDWNDLLVLSDLRVIEYTLERERLTLECREI